MPDLRSRLRAAGPDRAPLVTLVLIVPVTTSSVIGYAQPALFEALERQGGAVAHGQVWRLVTPLLVQTDGWKALLSVMCLLLVVGVVAEPLFGHARFLALFLLAGMVGHSVGIVWQPGAGGASVGALGPAGALAALLLRPPLLPRDHAARPVRPLGRLVGAAAVVTGVALLTDANIHGPALLAGICLGFALLALDPGVTARRSGGRGFDELAALGGRAPAHTMPE
jgi:membrane associated rhomboid family serine protease